MKFITIENIIPVLLLVLLTTSCGEEWLEVKRDKRLIVPTTLKDMRMLLREEGLLARDYIALAEISSDDCYATSDIYHSRTLIERNAYLWKADIYEGQEDIPDWDRSYAQVEVANVVLDALPDIAVTGSNREEWNDVKGIALHLRARAFFNLVTSFARPYQPETSDNDPGISLRLTSDPNVPTVRANVQETYERIISDLEEASKLLRDTPEYRMDPSKPAAYGLLARVYLGMEDYEMAGQYADSCLNEFNTLVDLNTVDASVNFPLSRFNAEVIQHTEIYPLYFLTPFSSRVDPDLYDSYEDNDLRKAVFFRDMGDGSFAFKGSYTGSYPLFSGIAVNEMYLIRAECRARSGQMEAAMDNLNTLLETRFTAGTFTPLEVENAQEALEVILKERRKELLRRGQRWNDLRRLNADPAFASTIVRTIDGVDYSLEPGDPKYVLPIPDYVISVSGIGQNER